MNLCVLLLACRSLPSSCCMHRQAVTWSLRAQPSGSYWSGSTTHMQHAGVVHMEGQAFDCVLNPLQVAADCGSIPPL